MSFTLRQRQPVIYLPYVCPRAHVCPQRLACAKKISLRVCAVYKMHDLLFEPPVLKWK